MRKTLLIFLFLFTLGGLYAQSYDSISQKSDTITHSFDVDEVTVVGRRSSQKIIPVQTLSGETLNKLSAHSVADAIRYFSGVQIKDFGGVGGLKTVNIRSMGSQHVGVFYDGVELGNAQNGTIDLGRFSLDNMEAISLYNGQKSSIFQPAKDFASAGSIYMRTRVPFFDENKNYNIKATLKTGSFGTINPSLLYEQKISENISSSASAEYLYSTGKYKFSYSKANGYDTTEVRQNGDVESLRVEGALFGKINQGEWKTKVYSYNSERGYPGASVREEPGVFKNQDRQWDNNLFAQGSFRKSFSSFYSLLFSAKYANDYLHYLSDPNLDASTMYVDNKYTQQEVYSSVANQFLINDWWSANLSLDYLRNSVDADLVDFVYPKRNTVLTALATSFMLKKLKIQASVLHTYVNDKTIYSGAEATDKSLFSPTVLASYKPFSDVNLNFRAFYKRIFRMPTLNDLYYTFIGNINLNPEYTNQYNVGVGYNKSYDKGVLSKFDVQVDAYYNEVENKIIAMPTSNQFRWTMVNLGYCEIKGVDLAAQFDWNFGAIDLNSRLNYTYQDARDKTDVNSSYYGGQIPYTPWHSGSAVLGGAYKSWELNYSFIYTGERYESQANIAENYAQPWYTHDMSVSKMFNFKKMGLRVTTEVNNILNQQYEVVRCYPMPGTNVKLIINVIL